MKTVKKSICLLTAMVLAMTLLLTACGGSGATADNKVVIFTSAEEYRVEALRTDLAAKFPNYNITIEYMSTGNNAAKLIAEGTATECDIVHSLEYGYLEQISQKGTFADLSAMDFSMYTADASVSKFYAPELRNGGAIIVNPKVLADKGLAEPTSYADLLKPEYKGLISMPNPKSSGTGYMFYKALVNSMGEEKALAYFDGLSKNILQFTSSGSGPVNALIQGEVAVGLGMTAQAVTAINNGTDLKILYFSEGSPYSMYGHAMVSGKETKPAVKEVFDYIVNTFNEKNNKEFYPEQIFKDNVPQVKNYPTNIKYADMSGDTIEEKQRLLELWKY